MTLHQLRYFMAVARHLNFTRAAEELTLAQPALSQQISALEQELRVRLLERKPSVRLTDAGAALLEGAGRILAEVQATAEEMGTYAEGIRGRVVVGTNQSLSETTLPRLLSSFHREYPAIEIALREGLARGLAEGLKSGHFDVVVGDVGQAAPALSREMQVSTLSRDEVGLAVAPNHRLAGRSLVRFSELEQERFVIFPHGSVVTNQLFTHCRAAGFEPQVAFESTDNMAVRALVAEGLGVTLLPRTVLRLPGPSLKLIPLDPPQGRTISLVYRRGSLGPALRRFVSHLREHYPAQ